MALGDKKPVVMEADLGLPLGPASLDGNGILEKSQWPGEAEFGLANTNLLHNWYFANPVNTMGGDWMVPGGTPYYSDTSLSTQEGTVEYYALATYIDGVYGSITVEDVVYYVDWAMVVQGFQLPANSARFFPNKWYSYGTASIGLAVMLVGDALRLIKSVDGVGVNIRQSIRKGWRFLPGERVTASFLAKGNTDVYSHVLIDNDSEIVPHTYFTGLNETEYTLCTATYTMPDMKASDIVLRFGILSGTSTSGVEFPPGYIDILAAKFELGDKQTLAHQDESGKWVLNEIPNWTEQYVLCQQYSDSPTTGAFAGNQHSNPNLLDNHRFDHTTYIIDQKQGYVVPPDTPYYSDTGLAAQAGTVSAYTTANYVDGMYGTVTISSTTYYVDWTQAVRGYTNTSTSSSSYGIDRWKIAQGVMLIEDKYIKIKAHAASGYKRFTQISGNGFESGKTYTASMLARVNEVPTSMQFRLNYEGINHIASKTIKPTGSRFELFTVTTTLSVDRPTGGVDIFSGNTASDYFDIDIIAMKLEEGLKQTLAHLDDNGNWVLNDPPPNKALELAKCQRYDVTIQSIPKERNTNRTIFIGTTRVLASSPKYLYVELPVPVPLRAFPTVSFNNLEVREYDNNGGYTIIKVDSNWNINVVYASPSLVGIQLTSPTNLDPTKSYSVRILGPSGYIRLNANL